MANRVPASIRLGGTLSATAYDELADIILADYLQGWLDADYQVLVTADHGMNRDRSHNGLLAEEREVPLFVIGTAFSLSPEARPRQLELCGTICELLGVEHDKPACRALLGSRLAPQLMRQQR